ncbi:MAG: arabinogalactan endo-beta-1,4-galactanase [Treponema sp.]
MKKTFSLLLLSLILITFFFTSCSNPSTSGSSAGNSNQTNTSANNKKTFTGSLELLVSADDLQNASKVTISFSNISDPDCWITIAADTKRSIQDTLKSEDWSTTEFKSVITDLDNASEYLSNGIYIAGTSGVTATITVTIIPQADSLDSFCRGVDASMVKYLEDNGAVYKTSDGTTGDFFAIIKSYGVNWVRFRLWVDPKTYASQVGTSDSTYPQGLCDLDTVKELAARAQNAGLRWLLDFHYSDTWTHPGQQIIPLSWSSVSAGSEMAEKISEYTTEVLTELKNSDLIPDMVQVGNEVTSGMCVGKTSDTSNLQSYLEAGCKAVKEFDSNILVMIHVDKGGSSAISSFFNNFGNDYYDVIGLSWYPMYDSHGSIQNLGSNISTFAKTGKKVIVVETSWAWGNGYNDWTNNVCGKSDTATAGDYQYTAASLLDYTGITISTDSDSEKYVEATEENQYNVLNAVFKVAKANNGNGVFYWGGEWIAYGTQTESPYGSTWENQALFNFSGIPLKALEVFSNSDYK